MPRECSDHMIACRPSGKVGVVLDVVWDR